MFGIITTSNKFKCTKMYYLRYGFGMLSILMMVSSCCRASGNESTKEDYDYSDDEYQEYNEYNEDDSELVPMQDPTDNPSSQDTKKYFLSNDYIYETVVDSYNCPVECDCSNHFEMTNCSSKDLSTVPVNFSRITTEIDLSFNVIEELGDFDFANCTNVKTIILKSNKLTHINSKIFNNLPLLDSIDFANNSITWIDPDTFKTAQNVKNIDLSYNPLQLSEALFLDLPNLESLALKGCHIHKVEYNNFQTLNGLLLLDLQENQLGTEFNTTAFAPLKALQNLKLDDVNDETIKKLCKVLVSVDSIILMNRSISCFILASGGSLEESIGPVPVNDKAVETLEKEVLTTTPQPRKSSNTIHRKNISTQSSIVTTPIPLNESNVSPQLEESKLKIDQNYDSSYQISISTSTVNKILIGIAAVALIGLIIGIICRKDICGIKTRLCRTRRPASGDQPKPPEEVPLNKI